MNQDQVRQEVTALVRIASDMFLACHSTGYFKEYKRIMAIARGINKSLDMSLKDRIQYLKQYNISYTEQGFKMFKFNVGSAVQGKDQAISTARAFVVLYQVGFNNLKLRSTAKSNTETTYVITAESFTDAEYDTHTEAVHAACVTLEQDCIAYTQSNEGFLIGPKAADWGGTFNPEYFIK